MTMSGQLTQYCWTLPLLVAECRRRRTGGRNLRRSYTRVQWQSACWPSRQWCSLCPSVTARQSAAARRRTGPATSAPVDSASPPATRPRRTWSQRPWPEPCRTVFYRRAPCCGRVSSPDARWRCASWSWAGEQTRMKGDVVDASRWNAGVLCTSAPLTVALCRRPSSRWPVHENLRRWCRWCRRKTRSALTVTRTRRPCHSTRSCRARRDELALRALPQSAAAACQSENSSVDPVAFISCVRIVRDVDSETWNGHLPAIGLT